MATPAIEEKGGRPAAKLIRVRDGGAVGISRGPWGAAGRPMTSLQVQGSEGFADLADGEVRLEADELARLVLELVDRLPNEHRQQIAETLARAR